MKPLEITVLDPIKLPLVSRLYKAHYPSAKAKRNELTLTGYCDATLAAVVRLRPIDQYRLLTGMLVIPSHQNMGYGHQLLNYCQQHLLTGQDFCFAYQHLQNFYAGHGFHALEADALPHPLSTLFQRYSSAGKQLVAMQYQPTGPLERPE